MIETGLSILHVEDDEVDAMAVARALELLHKEDCLHRVSDSEKALAYLKENPKPKNPRVILLDLNIPRMNGLEFLKYLKRDQALQAIPVIVLTTSSQAKDKNACYALGVAGYFTKCVDPKQFHEVIKSIYHYWRLCDFPE